MCTRLLSQPHKNVSTSTTHMTVSKAATTSMYPWTNKLPMFPCFQKKREGRKSPPKVYNVTDDKREWTSMSLTCIKSSIQTHTHAHVHAGYSGECFCINEQTVRQMQSKPEPFKCQALPCYILAPIASSSHAAPLAGVSEKREGEEHLFLIVMCKKNKKINKNNMAAEIVGDINNDENNVNEKWKMTWGVKHGWLFKKKT